MAIQKLKIGKFSQDEMGNFYGTISGLGIGSIEVISQVVVSQEGKIYHKLIADPIGTAYEIGAAFPKEKDGSAYHSVSLESPFLPNPLSAGLFPDRDNNGIFNLVWNKPELPKPSADATTSAGQSQSRRYIGAGAAP